MSGMELMPKSLLFIRIHRIDIYLMCIIIAMKCCCYCYFLILYNVYISFVCKYTSIRLFQLKFTLWLGGWKRKWEHKQIQQPLNVAKQLSRLIGLMISLSCLNERRHHREMWNIEENKIKEEDGRKRRKNRQMECKIMTGYFNIIVALNWQQFFSTKCIWENREIP